MKIISNPKLFFWLIPLGVVLLYTPFLGNPALFDDLYMFLDNAATLRSHAAHFNPLGLRDLPYATLGWTFDWFGMQTMMPFRLGNMLLHIAVGLVLFQFLSLLYREVLGADEYEKLAYGWSAGFAALLFALHPVSVYAVAYLVQRSILFATLFSLLALWSYLQGLTRANAKGWLFASVFCYTAAVFSKEHAIALPMVMLALTMLLRVPSRKLWKELWWVYVLCGLVAVYIVLASKGVLGTGYEPYAQGMLEDVRRPEYAYPLSMLTQATLFFKYVGLWLLPSPLWMSVDMREPFASGFLGWHFAGLLAYLATGVAGTLSLFRRGRPGLIGFAILFPWILFVTEFSTVRIQEIFVLYRSYLWVPGIFILLPLVFSTLPMRRKLPYAAILLALLLPATVERLHVFSDKFLLWDDAARLVEGKENLPGVWRIYYNRGNAFLRVGKYQDALKDYQKAAELYPKEKNTHYAVGLTQKLLGQYEPAMRAFDQAIRIDPYFAKAYHVRGLIYLMQLHDGKLAQGNFRVGCELGWEASCKKLGEIEKPGTQEGH
ncbi:MAG: tetratricopeptide repeat protein [Gallionellaceae bacterium]